MNREANNHQQPFLELRNVSKKFVLKQPILDRIMGKPKRSVHAVDDVSLVIHQGENMGLVGESGCGKSTLARTIMRLYNPDKGQVLFENKDLATLSGVELREERKSLQMIFQDPYSSLNPRMSVREMLTEVLTVHRICDKSEMEGYMATLLEMVGMNIKIADRFPGEFSGGQRQRLGIARALSVRPTFMIADEPVSALDVSIQAQIINLLGELQESLKLTILFISHDLRVVEHITHRVAVMYLGKIIELAPTRDLFKQPYHPYSQVLIQAAPMLDPRRRNQDSAIEGDPPSPIELPTGCRFHPRCKFARNRCKEELPGMREISPNRLVSCHFPLV
jgi:oligopeptide/dipeptide ABC transporter ATP-binding protein